MNGGRAAAGDYGGTVAAPDSSVMDTLAFSRRGQRGEARGRKNKRSPG